MLSLCIFWQRVVDFQNFQKYDSCHGHDYDHDHDHDHNDFNVVDVVLICDGCLFAFHFLHPILIHLVLQNSKFVVSHRYNS
jgi:hypothetical protein